MCLNEGYFRRVSHTIVLVYEKRNTKKKIHSKFYSLKFLFGRYIIYVEIECRLTDYI